MYLSNPSVTDATQSIACLNLALAEGRGDGFMSLSKAFARIETQTASFRIWTLVTDSISDEDNWYAKRASAAELLVMVTSIKDQKVENAV